jgi:integrase
LASFDGLEDVYTLLCEAVKGKKPEDHVLTRGKEPVKDFRGVWDSLCKAAGVDLLVHDLRRSAVRNMIRRGIPQKTAMTISGHKTAAVFERYNIVDDSDLKEAARKMAAGRKNGDRMVTNEGSEGQEAKRSN